MRSPPSSILCLSDPLRKRSRVRVRKHLEKVLDSVRDKVCLFCSADVAKTDLESHIKRCTRRPAPCRWCGREFPFDLLPDHARECPRRAEACEMCHSEVPVALMDKHRASCPAAEARGGLARPGGTAFFRQRFSAAFRCV